MQLKRLPEKWKWPAIFVVTAFLIVALLAVTKPEPKKSEVTEKEWVVSIADIQFEALSPELEVLGVVQSPFDSQLSAAISADVAHVPVREGQQVKQGELLIELDQRDIALTLAQREADVEDIKAQIQNETNRYEADLAALKQEQSLLAISEAAVQRQATLKQSNLVAQERYDQAASQLANTALAVNMRELAIQDHPSRLKQLKARLLRAQTALNEARLDKERSQIKAPFDGVITRVNVAPGERVQVGQSLLRLYDQGTMEVRAQIPNRFVPAIQQALNNQQTISATVQHYGTASTLTLSRLSGEANRGSGGIDALLVQTDPNTPLILNSTLKIRLTLPPLSQVSQLPITAIYGTNRVYRIEEGRIQALEITILGTQFREEGSDHVLIQGENLKNDDQIITTQLPNAISGLKVKVREQ